MANQNTIYSEVDWTYDEEQHTAVHVGLSLSEQIQHYRNGGEVVWQPTTVDVTQDNGFITYSNVHMVGVGGLRHQNTFFGSIYSPESPGIAPGRINYYKASMFSIEQPQEVSELSGYTWVCAIVHNVQVEEYSYSDEIVAISSDGRISMSNNGTTWTEANVVENLAAGAPWVGMGTKSSLLTSKIVALSRDGYLSTSEDGGLTWSAAAQNANLMSGGHEWVAIVGDYTGKFFALAKDGAVSTSNDGDVWATPTQPSALTGHTWCAMCARNNSGSRLFLLATDGYQCMSANLTTFGTAAQSAGYDGKTWVSCLATRNSQESLDQINFADGGWMASATGDTSTPGYPPVIPKKYAMLEGHSWLGFYTVYNKTTYLARDGYIANSEIMLAGAARITRKIEKFTFNGEVYKVLGAAPREQTDIYGIVFYQYYKGSSVDYVWLDKKEFTSPDEVCSIYSSIGRTNVKIGEITWTDLVLFNINQNMGYVGAYTLTDPESGVTYTGEATISPTDKTLRVFDQPTSEQDNGII